MALYGLKTSGAAFHTYLADIIQSLGWKPCLADPDAWYHLAKTPEGNYCYEYLMVYVDDILAISCDPKLVLDEFQAHFDMKGVGPPKYYLGANVGLCQNE